MHTSRRQPKSDVKITPQEAAQIGGRIRKLRGDTNQREFADRLGISREQLSRIESGAQVPGTETLRRLARVTHVPLDFILLGGIAGPARAAVTDTSSTWEAALEPLLVGTTLRLPRASASSGRKIDRAWQELSEDRREDIRNFVRRIALVAVAIEELLSAKSAKAVNDQLSMELSTALIDRIVETP